jgi:hypothetical protein
LNGKAEAAMPATLSNNPVTITNPKENVLVYDIDLGNGEHVLLKSFKLFMSVAVQHASASTFEKSVGLMGSYVTGEKFGRDGETNFEGDWLGFGQEWQVAENERMLFHEVSGPQICTLSSETEVKRRCLGSSLSEKSAEDACAHITDAGDREWCVFDVLETGDAEMAGAY